MKFLRSRAALGAALALVAALAACDSGTNPFRPVPPVTGPGGSDAVKPTVDVLLPTAQAATVNVGDSVFVRARVRDDRGVVSARFQAFAVRGRPELGTDTAIARFAEKVVDLRTAGRAVTDTTLDRFLLATTDTLAENGVLVVVTATDSAGNSTADTTRINLVSRTVAPTVQILSPTAASGVVPVGDSIFVSARVGDDRRLARVTFSGFSLRGDPALGTAVVVPRFVPKEVNLATAGRAVTDTVLNRFLNATGDTVRESGVYVVVTATDSSGFTTSDTVQITIGGAGVVPQVEITAPATGTTVVLGDPLLVRARAQDDRRLASVSFSAYSVRGNPAQGTGEIVPRYVTRTVDMSTGRAVRDTVVERVLMATPDTVREPNVYVVVTATDSTGLSRSDTVLINIAGPSAAPTVDILVPNASADSVGVGDSLFVQARVQDDRRLARVVFQSFSVRGSVALGTDTVVVRHAPRTVDLTAGGVATRDTVIGRFLPATSDTIRETGVYVVVTATDTSGISRADTARITISGAGVAPQVDITAPTEGASVLLGDPLLVRARVRDDRRVASVTLSAFSVRGNPAQGTGVVVQRYAPRTVDLSSGRAVRDTVLERVLEATADTARESGVYVVVTATDSSGLSRSDTVRITIAGPSAAPSVDIILPDTRTGTIAVGDSLFVRARVQDDRRLARVVFQSFSVRGRPELGTDTVVARFAPKEVDLTAGGRTVRDTVVDRFLLATSDTARETGVLVVVTAIDSAGLSTSDTARISIGGPRVQVTVPAGQDPRGGSDLRVRVVAEDARDLIGSVRVRVSGAFAYDQTITLAAPRAVLDTVLVIAIPPLPTDGVITIDASTISGSLQPGVAVPIQVSVRAAELDRVRPRTTFVPDVRATVEQGDTFQVTVTGVDETRVDSVGVTVLAIRRSGPRPDTLRVYRGAGPVTTGIFRFQISDLGLNPLDTAGVDLEVTAWSKDSSGNCGAAVSPNTPQQLECVAGPGGVVLSTVSGRVIPVFIARGTTVARPSGGADVIADLVADSRFVYLSNFTRNRVEVLPLGGREYAQPVTVGSQPWGLAIGRTGDSLYVANSGGTNFSVVPLGGPVLAEATSRRIFTRNERLFALTYEPDSGKVGQVTLIDYSDRPQFVAQTSNGLLVYSTRPTAAASDGTVRIYDPRKLRSEIFTGYVDRHTGGRAIVVNADSAFLLRLQQVRVCPRARFGDTSLPPCIDGNAYSVSAQLDSLRALPANAQGGRYDTRLDIGADIDEVGFSDTTFVATSTDRNYVAVGEGARDNARIPLFQVAGDSLLLRGDVRDLISNSADRVIGLGLNLDGSLGVARGNEAYFFNNELRRQGSLLLGQPTGGVAMHPQSAMYPTGSVRLAFVSGVENGRFFIDVVDAFSFERKKRVFTRDPVVGALVVAPRATGDAPNVNLRLYALTSGGVLGLELTNEDLQ
ncbi:YncE family protein [Longimicrobium terrae]|uniref:Uncharacterized protein n=1 Tax=Longimicrobium terrae TaxID=1639882 RepID=A0A841H5M9_9BACT|nr:Ig-like domain-containing protein [Longimicrobium terrae]MBB4639209.1 hypothetical protein [Longimicrobium terrae]MBB6073387.1 hypothetical protein [Longimicrobium terrae]NNC32625.1 hypothetical protein [Longimicrobium terrae]